MIKPEESLVYVDCDGAQRVIRGCKLTVDHLDRYWLWSEHLAQNLAFRVKGREDALLAAIDSLLFTIQLRDDRIVALQRVHSLAQRFANEVFSEDSNHGV